MLSAAGLAGAGPAARGQGLPLPPVGIATTPSSGQITVEWDEAAPTAGRQVSGVTYLAWDFATSSNVAIAGAYAQDCDYRLRITKIPQDAGFNRSLRLVGQIFRNTTGTGAPLRVDTLRIVAPDSVHSFRTSFAGNLGVTCSANIGQPGGPLGTVPVTLHGMCSTLQSDVSYQATALNSVTDLSQGLMVRVSGPLGPGAVNTTLTVSAPGVLFPIMDAMSISFGNGAADSGDAVTWTAHHLFPANGRITADLEAFEGYHVWRSDLPDLGSYTLLGEIRQCESKFDLALVNEDESRQLDVELRYDPVLRSFTFLDRDVHDDFPYRYAVSTFDRGFLGNVLNLTFEGPLASSEKLYPAGQARDRRREIFVVPNPFKRSSDFQEGGARIVFANLPTQCTIRIFTEATDHLATLTHGPGEPRSTSPTSREWDLRSDSGLSIVPGIYIFHVQGTDRYEQPVTGGGTRTVTEAVEQVGKFIIVR